MTALAAALTLLIAGEIDRDSFIEKAALRHGPSGKQAAIFLYTNMPAADRTTLSEAFLLEEIELALLAQKMFPWCKKIPEELYYNDVLAYCVFDEQRDPWRREFFERCKPLVKDCKTISEAVQVLNREIFKLVNVHYNTGRKRPNQSAKESMASGRATCTGLSIILINACRSVGIPARAVGTPLWSNLRGNHTWVEVWDGDWKFTGADEYDQKGLNHGWFVGDASKAKPNSLEHAIYATSFRPTGIYFPMVWNQRNRNVHAVNVSSRYAKEQSVADEKLWSLGVRVLGKNSTNGGDRRIITDIELVGPAGVVSRAQSRCAPADLNDVARLDAPPGERYLLRIKNGNEIREHEIEAPKAGETTLELNWDELRETSEAVLAVERWLARPPEKRGDPPKQKLSKREAELVTQRVASDIKSRLQKDRAAEMQAKEITLGDKKMRFLTKLFGNAPVGKRSLWISMHGGGNTRPGANDRQWRNQIGLYQLSEGLYIAPRAPTNTWNLWHETHIDPMFDRLIANCVSIEGVDPNRVYIIGYSAGGDGVWQLAPRMADRFAAAGMMAGHPNEASQLPLRNLPFALLMGGDDSAYKRNSVAKEKATLLANLHKADPQGYTTFIRIYPGMGHWMQRKDAEALPWMAKHTRNPWPSKVVWVQDDVVSTRFYWLAVNSKDAVKEQQVIAECKGNTIQIKTDTLKRLRLRLNDALVDLDRPVDVEVNGKKVFSGIVERSFDAITMSLNERFDTPSVAWAVLDVSW